MRITLFVARASAALTAVVAVFISACGLSAQGPPAGELWREFSGPRAFAHVEKLVAFGPRPSGSTALEQSRQYLEGELRASGWNYREMETEGFGLPVIEAQCTYRESAKYDDEIEVRRVGGMIEPRPPVAQAHADVARVARARPEVQHRAAPTRARHEHGEALGVQRVRAALRAVKEQDARRVRGPGDVVEHEVVAVGRLEDLALEADEVARAGEPRPHRLQVWPADPPAGLGAREVHLDYNTGASARRPLGTARQETPRS